MEKVQEISYEMIINITLAVTTDIVNEVLKERIEQLGTLRERVVKAEQATTVE